MSQGALAVKRLCRVPPHVFGSETNVSRNEICPRELLLLKGYAEYRRMRLSRKPDLLDKAMKLLRQRIRHDADPYQYLSC